MTDTDATNRPLEMDKSFIPYLDKYRIYRFFKDMLMDLLVMQPSDHLKFMKVYCGMLAHHHVPVFRIIMLISPEIEFDRHRVIKALMKELGFFVITRRCILDHYQKAEDFEPGCVSPERLAAVTKTLLLREAILQSGWFMFDHPCTVREARCLQQTGVLPHCTLVLRPPEPLTPPTDDACTAPRSFSEQDFYGLVDVFKATAKVIEVLPGDDAEKIVQKCVSGAQAMEAGAQGAGQGARAPGAATAYRVVLIGPRGSGRKTQGRALAAHFGLVYAEFTSLHREALARDDALGRRLRAEGLGHAARGEIVQRRITQKDCIDHGYVLVEFPTSSQDFESLDRMPNPPNRIIFLHVDYGTCKARLLARAADWCSGAAVAPGAPRARSNTQEDEATLDAQLEQYFSETVAELRALAGFNVVNVDASVPPEKVQVKLQAAVMAAPSYDIECYAKLRNACGL